MLSAAIASGCGSDPAPKPVEPACTNVEMVAAPKERPNVVLIVADTLRRDRPGIYGGPAMTPNLDAFGRANLVFDAAVSQAPWTKPSIATLFTGVYPSQHGVTTHPTPRMGGERGQVLRSDVLAEGWSTIAETFAEHGYQTGAIVTNPWMQPKHGFAQGFDFYDISMARAGGPGNRVVAAGLKWLEHSEADERPFFLYLHFMDAHPPYSPLPADVAREHREQLRSDPRRLPPFQHQRLRERLGKANIKVLQDNQLPVNRAALELVYDQGVAQFDRALGDFISGLRSFELVDNTAMIITSDHGEALFSRGWFGHGTGLFDDETGALLLARLPGAKSGVRISCPVGLVDLRSTLCDYAGLTCPADAGISLLDDSGATGDRLVFSEGVISKQRHRSVRAGRFKLLWQPDGIPMNPVPKWALFDLAADPGETRNLLAATEPDPEIQQVAERLRGNIDALPAVERFEPESVEMDDETRQHLEDLGYLGQSN